METEQGRWDLSALYKGFDDPAFAADITRLEELMAGYQRQVHEREGLDAAALAALLACEEEMWRIGADLQKFTEMRREADAGDSQAVDAMGRLKAVFGSIAGGDGPGAPLDGGADTDRGGLDCVSHSG